MSRPGASPPAAASGSAPAADGRPDARGAQRSPLPPGWRRWYQRALPAYWIFLYAVTHFPKLRLRGPIEHPDLYSHFIAFGLLAFLFWRFIETLRPIGRRFVWIAGPVLLAYAAFDEWSQRFVGRTPTLSDLLANAGGIALTLAGLEIVRRRREAGRARQPAPPVAQPASRSSSP